MPDNVSVTLAEAIQPNPAWRSPVSVPQPEGAMVLRPFCRLAGRIEGDIGFEIWLPAPDHWNRRMLGTGVGGPAGYFNYTDMARGVNQGFVAASSDTGHGYGEEWISDARKTENYAHRAYHLLTVATKQIATSFYSSPVAYSYFLGCSGGGRQGLREIQLYPDDYDGALIGAPGLEVPLLAARLLHVHLAQPSNPQGRLDERDWDLIARAALKSCDAVDGLRDGIVDDPRECAFSVTQLQCLPGQGGECLSPKKVRTAQAIIAPLQDASGQEYDHGLLPGISPRPGGLPPLPQQLFGQLPHRDPQWDPRGFDIAKDLPPARIAFASMDARSADIIPFARRGGRIMLYHGWLDASVQPEASIDFFSRLPSRPDLDRADYARLYMVPGMLHCRGGNGTGHFGGSDDLWPTGVPETDMLAALIAWVERDIRPGAILARRLENGTPERERPLCPYPQRAQYLGAGSVDSASSFACRTPASPAADAGDQAGGAARSPLRPTHQQGL